MRLVDPRYELAIHKLIGNCLGQGKCVGSWMGQGSGSTGLSGGDNSKVPSLEREEKLLRRGEQNPKA